MASKEELLGALNERADMLRGWLKDIGNNVGTKQLELRDLHKQRQDKLAGTAARFLPDLSEGSLEALQRTVPNFLTGQQAAQMRHQESEAIKSQLDHIKAGFDPDSYQGNSDMLAEQLGTTNRQLDALDADFASLMSTPGLDDLIRRHYGDESYTRDPHHRILGRLYDWVHADDVARELGVDGWPLVRNRYDDLIARKSMLNQTIEQTSARLEQLRQNKGQYDELASLTDEALEQRVLEKARTGLAARLDSSEEPGLLRGVGDVDAQISTLRSEINTLQAKKSTVSEQLDQTLQLRMTAARSPRQQVPDEYVTQVRSSIYPSNLPISGGYGYHETYIQPVYLHHDTSWMLPTLFYRDMADHWGGCGGSHQTVINNYIDTSDRDAYASASNFSSSS